eukprot:TRINITY_DN18299_c0_g1_i1.p1 TRINITY_DN18299_c0_g1~~TRINITY_DN18299_c0_g1_i1.p1  ORF type:complete len:153 (+),score=15.79 TRINITY_DN18299_c0_g1_i1:82-540(+)
MVEQDARSKVTKYIVSASVVSAGLYSFVLSHCWYGRGEEEDEEDAGKEDHPIKESEPIITIACSIIEALCLYHMSRSTPGKVEGPATAWLEVSVLGSLLSVSSSLLQNSASFVKTSSFQPYHVGFDVSRICGSAAMILGVEHALRNLSSDEE